MAGAGVAIGRIATFGGTAERRQAAGVHRLPGNARSPARSVSSLSLLNVRHILGRSATIAQRVGLREDERCAYGWLGAP